ncbi:hypothetical protein OF83DRAFT_1022313, partial [Amylostereum chailletii]
SSVKPRTYDILARFLPVNLDVTNAYLPGEIEWQNNLEHKAVLHVEWVKDPERRREGQKVAVIRIIMRSPEAVERLRDRHFILNGTKFPTTATTDDIRGCFNCQGLDGHYASACKRTVVCAQCGTTGHSHRECTITDPSRFACVNCNQSGHAAWDRACP